MSREKTDKIKIRLEGTGVKYASTISPTVAAAILNLCLSAQTKDVETPAFASGTVHSSSLHGKKLSVVEYVHKHEPTSYPAKIVVIAGYLKEIEGKETFSPDEIRPFFRRIGDVPPANFARDFRVALRSGWIASDNSDPNAFYITTTGEQALNAKFSEAARQRTGRVRKKKRAQTEKRS